MGDEVKMKMKIKTVESINNHNNTIKNENKGRWGI